MKDKWRDIRIFSDGSGKAGKYFDAAAETIDEREAVLKLNRAFIEKHKATLAGLLWRVGYLDPAIHVDPIHYRGSIVVARDIAKLWPGARWKRTRREYEKEQYDWIAIVDGVSIIIERAESEKPKPKLRECFLNLR